MTYVTLKLSVAFKLLGDEGESGRRAGRGRAAREEGMMDVLVMLKCATCGQPVEAFASDLRRLRSLGAPEDWYCRTECWQTSRAEPCSHCWHDCPETGMYCCLCEGGTHYDDAA